MKRALVIGSSGGIGSALCRTLAQAGWKVVGLSRSSDGLDLTKPNDLLVRLNALEGIYDLIMVATGMLAPQNGRPEKSLKALNADQFAQQFAVNTIGPALIMAHATRLMPRDRLATLAVLSARVGSIGDNRLGGWYSYRASKAALNQVVKTASIELARTHPRAVCVAIHPGTVATQFTAEFQNHHATVQPMTAAQNIIGVLARLAPSQTGGFFDWSGAEVPW